MGFNCLRARATSRRQFTFYHLVQRNFWYWFYQPRKDERLSQPLVDTQWFWIRGPWIGNTTCVPDDDTVTPYPEQSLKNFERPILWSGYLSLYATWSFFRLLNSRCFCTWTLLAMLAKSFPPGIILKNLSSS